MRYGSMEEAVGQYLALLLKFANIEIYDPPSRYYDDVLYEQCVTVKPLRLSWDSQILFDKFKNYIMMVREIKQDKVIDISKLAKNIANENDEDVATWILIHAVREKYINKSLAADVLAQLSRPHTTAVFMAETKDIYSKEELDL